MARTLSRMFFCVVMLLSIAAAERVGAEVLADKLLPASTKGFLSATNADEVKARWAETQVGQLMADPVMQPFVEDFRGQMQDRFSDLQKKLGLTIEDVQDVPSGESTIGVIEASDGNRAMVVLMDVTGRLDEANAMIAKATRNLMADGATRSEATWWGTDVIILDIPDDEEQLPQEAIYFLQGNFLGAADSQEEMKSVLARLAGEAGSGKSLADVEAFQVIMARAQEDAGEWTPQIRWFVEPIAYMELQEKANPPEEKPQGKTNLEIAKSQGMEAIRGVGGFVDMDVEDFEFLHRTKIYAPNREAWEKSMKMIVTPNRTEFAPQEWVSRDIATYNTIYGDLLHAFDNFGPLFDELFGEGETDVWKDVTDSLKEDPNGPQIDLREELFVHFAQRVSMISDYVLPITTTSERYVFGIEAKDAKKVAAAIEKTLKGDPEIKRRVHGEHIIWESVPVEASDVPTTTLGGVPPVGGYEEDDFDEEDSEPFFPNTSVTVAYGHLLVASHYDFLIKVLDAVKDGDTLGRDVDFRVVTALLEKIGADEDCVRTFSRTDEELRTTYELFRQGKLPEAETMFARLINGMLGVNEAGELRSQEIDGSQLPDYDFVRRHLGPAGMFGKREEGGWFLKGFLLNKQGL